MTARRWFACVVVGLLFASVFVSPVAARGPKRQERTVMEQYTTPAAIAEAGGGGAYACSPGAWNGQANIGCIEVPVKPTEQWASVEGLDVTGLPTPMWVGQDGVKGGKYICGTTEEPFEVAPGVPLFIWIYPYLADPLCLGAATTGTVTITFTGISR